MGGGNPAICLGTQKSPREHLWGPWHKAKEWTPDGSGKMSTRRICKRETCGTIEFKVSKKEMREYIQALCNQGMK